LLTDLRGFQIADFIFPKITNETVTFSFMLALVTVLDILFLYERNGPFADDTIRPTITSNKKVLASPVFFKPCLGDKRTASLMPCFLKIQMQMFVTDEHYRTNLSAVYTWPPLSQNYSERLLTGICCRI
jgi:hypothetical protein